MILAIQVESEKKELMMKLGLKDREYFRIKYLQPALKEKFIEMVYPDRPRHPGQKYRLSEAGEILKESLEN